MLSVAHNIEAAMNHKLVATSLITSFFDFISHPHLLCTLRRKGIPLPIVKWVLSFLSDCYTSLMLDGQQDEIQSTRTGIPQGSCVSPVLAAYFSSPLINRINKATSSSRIPTCSNPSILADSPHPTSTTLYVDDSNILIISKSVKTNIKLAKYAYLAAEKWTHHQGLSLDAAKSGLIHFTQPHLELVSPAHNH